MDGSAAILLLLSAAAAAARNDDFDFLMFTQMWPATSCLEWKDSGNGHECTIQGAQSEWTIHGIWPTRSGEIGPLNCNQTAPFDIKALQPLLPELESQWLDVRQDSVEYSFWRHEWVKHGTCAMQLASMDTELKYFGKALELHEKYNVFRLLGDSGIEPKHRYSPEAVVRKVSEELCRSEGSLGCGEGSQPPNVAVNCAHDKDYDVKLFYELIICLDKNFVRIGCEHTKGGLYGTCREDVMLYPDLEEPSGIGFQCFVVAILLIGLLLALLYYFFRRKRRGDDYSAI